jgi:hypothetical protein
MFYERFLEIKWYYYERKNKRKIFGGTSDCNSLLRLLLVSAKKKLPDNSNKFIKKYFRNFYDLFQGRPTRKLIFVAQCWDRKSVIFLYLGRLISAIDIK